MLCKAKKTKLEAVVGERNLQVWNICCVETSRLRKFGKHEVENSDMCIRLIYLGTGNGDMLLKSKLKSYPM